MTIKKMIAELTQLAEQYGEDTRCCVYDDYTANEGWDYEEEDLYLDCCAHYDKKQKVVLIG